MRRVPLIFLIACVLAPVVGSASGQTFSMTPLPDDPVVEPQIIGGHMAKRSNWPATFVIDDICTSTAVGKRVVLTAAHCVGDGATGQIKVGDKEIDLTCSHHPKYTPDDTATLKTTSADWALCAATSDLGLVEYETINPDAQRLNKGRQLWLTGYGCNTEGGSDHGFWVLFEGESEIWPIPNATDPDGLPKSKNPRSTVNYATTKGGAAVCFGDSGGATYLYLDGAKKSRVIVGVNSRGAKTISYISSTSTEDFQSWARKWAGDLEICGLNEKTTPCHP